MIITFGRFKLIKCLLLLVAIFKIIRESIKFSKLYYGYRNILLQYLFICFAKFANVIFWFFVMKNIKFPKKIMIPKKEEIFSIDKEEEKINHRFISKGFSQKEINLNEKEKVLKKRYYKQITYLITSSIIDFIANSFYLFSLAYIANDLKKNETNLNNSTEIIENFILNDIIDDYDNITNITEKNTTNNNTQEIPNDNLVNLIPFRIMFRISIFYLFFELFLHFEKMHRHQYISLLSIIIISLFVYFEYFKDVLKQKNFFLIHLPISFFQEFSFCLYKSIGAKYLSISNGNIYKLLFFNGLFGIIMIFIINFFLTDLISCKKLNIDILFCNNDTLKTFSIFDSLELEEYINISFTLIMSIIEMASMWLLILYQTVNHLSVACAIHLFFRFLIGKKAKSDNHYIIGIACFLFILFFTFVFNEIIILRFCSLHKNTKEEIEKRAIDDKIFGGILSADSSMEGSGN